MTLDEFVTALGQLGAPDASEIVFKHGVNELTPRHLSHVNSVSVSAERGDLSEVEETDKITVTLGHTCDVPQDAPVGEPYPEGPPPKFIHPPTREAQMRRWGDAEPGDEPLPDEGDCDKCAHPAVPHGECGDVGPPQDYGINPDDFPEPVPEPTPEPTPDFSVDPDTGLPTLVQKSGPFGASGGVQRK